VPVRPYGTWPGAIGSDVVARASGRNFGAVDIADTRVRWAESRPDEAGRVVVVEARSGGAVTDVTPVQTNARTRVHEYGGGAVCYHGNTVFFSEFADGRLYRLDVVGGEPRPGSAAAPLSRRRGGGGGPRPITPAPAEPHALRYADGTVTPDGSVAVCVRERHEAGEVYNELVLFPADGSAEPRVIAAGHDFFMAPRLDPAGRRLAWLAWDHPRMPWDGTELWIAELDGGVLREPRLVAGGPEESVIDPRFAPDGELHFCSDRSGRWNLYRESGPLSRLDDAEIGFPGLGLRDEPLRLPRRRSDRLRRHAQCVGCAPPARPAERRARAARPGVDGILDSGARSRSGPRRLLRGVTSGAAHARRPRRRDRARGGAAPVARGRPRACVDLGPARDRVPDGRRRCLPTPSTTRPRAPNGRGRSASGRRSG